MKYIFLDRFPLDIRIRIEEYLYLDTNGDSNYRKHLKQRIQCELKRQFCYNCRNHLSYLNQHKNRRDTILTIPKYIYNIDNMCNNIYNTHCILELSSNNQHYINHWHSKDIIIQYNKPLTTIDNYKFVKLFSGYGDYPIFFDIEETN